MKRICNIGARKFLVTIPNIEYWLTFIMDSDPLGTYLESLCCQFDPADWKQDGVDFFKKAGKKLEQVIDEQNKQAGTPWSLFWQAVNAPTHKLTVERLLLAALGARNGQGQAFANKDELAFPTEALMFNQVLAPFMRTIVPASGAPSGSDKHDLRELLRQVGDLQSTVKTQQRTINQHKQAIKELTRNR